MRLFVAAIAVVPMLAAAAQAQTYSQATNSFSSEPQVPQNTEIVRLYDFGPEQRGQNPEAVMRWVRSTCARDGRSAQQRCAGAKDALEGAFAEYRVRAANGTLRSQR